MGKAAKRETPNKLQHATKSSPNKDASSHSTSSLVLGVYARNSAKKLSGDGKTFQSHARRHARSEDIE